uniref:Protein kintoun n=1 Tax=Phallusia mammillata TaxID=59560 RepID=A0A6F9D8G5_9ASCI|nr:protein kintoun [Phallusia mammillata]
MESGKFGEKLEELDLSQEEIDRLAKCMKDEKFRDLLREYAEEISDPENRKRYEEEIAMLERDRGMDVKFINPKPGHVLKTSINGKQKCFVNICTNENLGQPRSRPSMQGNTRGMQWSIPHSVSQDREDVDKAGNKCMVYDVVFHPDTYYLLKKNSRFKKMIHDTALDAVERQFSVKLDKVNVKTPKMQFKGLPMSSVIRTPHANDTSDSSSSQSQDEVDVKLKPSYQPTDNGSANVSTQSPNTAQAQPFPILKEEVKKVKQTKQKAKGDDVEWGYIEPEYSIMHRGYFDMQNYTNAPNAASDTWPKELVINIDLPLLSAANSVNLEVFERRLRLESVKPAKYKLDFELSYPVDENKGFAKFDKSRHRLTVTLEVLPAPPPPKLIPFTSPPLVNEIQTDQCDVKDESQTNANNTEENTNAVPTDSSSTEIHMTNSTKDAAVETDRKPPVKQTPGPQEPAKQPHFFQEGSRHYQEGVHWRDDDDLHDDPVYNADTKFPPITKNSTFLIDMVRKYEGLIRRCPQYAFHQDDHYVTFIIEVPHIFEESLWYAVYDRMLQFCCLSECLDDDMVNSVFQLWIEFDDDCRIDPQRSRVDVSGNNAVFCLRKTKSRKSWNFLKAGFDKEKLETRRFATDRNVCELYTLVYNHAEKMKSTPISVCKVVKQEQDLLILELEPKDRSTPNEAENKPPGNEADSTSSSEENFAKQNGHAEEESKNIVSDFSEDKLDAGDSCPTQDQQSSTKTTNSFAENVKEHAKRREEEEEKGAEGEEEVIQDSDDEEENEQEEKEEQSAPRNPAPGIVTVKNSDGSTEEVIIDHVTKSAVTLTSESLLFEIDDDV